MYEKKIFTTINDAMVRPNERHKTSNYGDESFRPKKHGILSYKMLSQKLILVALRNILIFG